jgi:hypothetical protein
MEKAHARRWLVLFGVVVVAALLLAILVFGSALAHGRSGWTSSTTWGSDRMIAASDFGASSRQRGYGMMPHRGIPFGRRQGEIAEEAGLGWAYTPGRTGDHCPKTNVTDYGDWACPERDDGALSVPDASEIKPLVGWDCPGQESDDARLSGDSGKFPFCRGFSGRRCLGSPGRLPCDRQYDEHPEPGSSDRSEPTAPQGVSFQADVKPIFDASCVSCHGNSGGLSLASYAGVMQGGTSGLAVIAGNPSESRLIRYVETGYMPLQRPSLTPAQIQALVDWIASGAPDS